MRGWPRQKGSRGRLLDIGCGALRVGGHLVEFLEEGNYFGIDGSQEMLDAGYDIELAAMGQQSKLERNRLVATEDFDLQPFSDGRLFDVALAQSVFTHLPIGYLRICLGRLAPVMKPGSVAHATFLLVPNVRAWLAPFLHEPGGISSHPLLSPFHHTHADIVHATRELPWSPSGSHDISHPRDQMMVRFTRLEDGNAA